ncbi:serine/threonine protein kinase [Gordonia desulfuricans]|uniref:non-specific serine/threonine protein kinase n=2 Tax=Gordonia desulfuricans TaxID=89051 RepID=A0A7K3LQD7_9ACTN|nr:serine/threonine-protein kinase [Gordonia desulfuricans]NDK90453.1 serine/threonine protein kinase [Gordonia desulfuricans]
MSGSRVNTQFGPYRLDELLGRGGMGEVYRAYDTVKDRVVAVKLLNPGLAGDATYQERFKRESHAAARLGEPHVIPIHDWGEIEGVLFIDMRLVDGEDLRALLRRERPLEAERAVAIVEQVASALDAAHADGLVHRDIKPENILIGQNDFAYLVDFGIAHGADDTHLTQAGSAIGSIAYMAPELFDAVPVSTSSDIYALACVLFECLTGRVPHPADTITSAIKAAVMSPPPAPSAVNTAVPSAMDSVIARGLDPDPARRYGTATELAAAARAALRGEADPAAGAAAPTTVTPGRPGRIDLVKSDGAHPPAPPTVIGSPSGEESARATQLRPVGEPGPQNYSGPQQYSGPQNYSGPQQYSGPQNYSGPQQYPGAPAAYGAAAYPAPGYQPPPERDRSVAYVLIGVIAVAVLGLVAVGAYWLFSNSSGDDTAATSTATVTAAPPVTEQTTETVTPVFPADAVPCDATSAIGTTVTSCPFAQAVRDAYRGSGTYGQARTVQAFSPVTGLPYQMACTPEGSAVTCRGGNNAVVYVLP